MKYLKNYNTFILEKYKYHDYSTKEYTSLIGLNIPEFIDGDFNCNENDLRNLEGGPKIVSGCFTCCYNGLTSLKGSPIETGKYFSCSNNKLTSLEGGPKEVMTSFYCYNNELKTLDYLPNFPNNLECYNNSWIKPIPYKVMEKYNLHCLRETNDDDYWVYSKEQFNRFSTFEFQKEFLENEPENFIDLRPFGYANGIEELFPHLFDMDELGLID
jgi:hypothetical protein